MADEMTTKPQPVPLSEELPSGVPLSASQLTSSSRSASQRAYHHGHVSPSLLSISHPNPPNEHVECDNQLSDLDSHNFTHSLHASLVSEILSLRREIDNKGKLIVGLEEQLNTTEQENVHLSETVNGIRSECHDLRRTLLSLEGGSEDALQKLAQERDAIDETASELKRRLELIQKKLKAREEEIDLINSLWNSDKDRWDEQRLALDRKVHTVESRSRLLVRELEMTQDRMESLRLNTYTMDSRPHSRQVVRPLSQNGGARSSQSHQRENSADSHDIHLRFPADDFSKNRPTDVSHSLADELGIEYEQDNTDEGIASEEAFSEELEAWTRPFSSHSNHELAKARKVLGLNTAEYKSAAYSKARNVDDRTELDVHALTQVEPVRDRQAYRDMATQWSLPSSPLQHDDEYVDIAEATSVLERGSAKLGVQKSGLNDPAGNEKSSLMRPISIQSPPVSMISQGSQTIDLYFGSSTAPRSSRAVEVETDRPMRVASTQTEVSIDVLAEGVRYGMTNENENVPAILAQSPQTRCLACQGEFVCYKSTYVQASRSSTPEKQYEHVDENKFWSTQSVLREESTTKTNRQLIHRGHVPDDFKLSESGSLNEQHHPHEKKGESLVNAQVESDTSATLSLEHSSKQINDITSEKLTDDTSESRELIDKKFTQKNINRKSEITSYEVQNPASHVPPPNRSPPSPPLSDKKEIQKEILSSKEARQVSSQQDDSEMAGTSTDLAETSTQAVNTIHELRDIQNVAKRSKEADIRKQALTSSGAPVNLSRPRSPGSSALSNGGLSLDPPFPVPDRSSSRKLPSETDSSSVFEGEVTFFGGGIYGKKMMRKTLKRTRSVSTSSNSIYRREEKLTPATTSPPAPVLPDASSLLSEDWTRRTNTKPSPIQPDPPLSIIDPHDPSQGDSNSQRSSAIASVHGSNASGPTSVVDAIAQTMIGEWMWKYVRRRKSFGLPEKPATEFELGKNSDINAARHQRWVWLAPYERAVMWSSKQPTSGTALMGKSGRKLVIRSVLDVKDDNPLPKGTDSSRFFGRSILILTAQRALKFTALNRERHFIWLAALSFLSHSSVIPQSLAAASPVPDVDLSLSSSRHLKAIVKRQSAATLQGSGRRNSVLAAREGGKPSLISLNKEKQKTFPSTSADDLQLGTKPDKFDVDDLAGEDKAAEAPLVPRFATHSRRRNNIGSNKSRHRSFKGFANTQTGLSRSVADEDIDIGPDTIENTDGWTTEDGKNAGNSFLRNVRRRPKVQQSAWRPPKTVNSESLRVYLADYPSRRIERPASASSFEAIETVRMEAFVQGLELDEDVTTERRSHKNKKQILPSTGTQIRNFERLSSQNSYRKEEANRKSPESPLPASGSKKQDPILPRVDMGTSFAGLENIMS